MPLRVRDLELARDGDEAEVAARVDAPSLGWRGVRLWFRVPRAAAPASPHGDAFAVALLLPAMAAGLDLEIDGPVSPSLAGRLAQVQSVVCGWNERNPWARFRRVRLASASAETPPVGGDENGLFFTAGVDSVHSLLRFADERGRGVHRLLYVDGYDVSLTAAGLALSVREHLARAAAAAGRPLSVVRTNVREVVDPIVSWEMEHGAALAAVGHVLASCVQRWIISSADAYITGAAYGTAETLDPLWSRDGLEFITGGAGLDRLTKLSQIAGEPVAERHLLVCWQRRPRAGNCGRCAKCVRTALQLLVLGALDRFDTLPHAIDPALVGNLLAEPVHRIFIWRDLHARLSAREEWAALAAEVDALVARSERVRRVPHPADLVTGEGRRLARLWLRRQVQPRLPVRLRRALKQRRSGTFG